MFNNVRVRYKILIMATVLNIGTIIMAGLGIFYLHDARVAMDGLYSRNLIAVDLSGDLRTEVATLDSLFLKIAMVQEQERDAVVQSIVTRLETIDSYADELKKVLGTEGLEKEWEELDKANDEVDAFTNKVMDYYKVNDQMGGVTYYRTNSNILSDYEEVVSQFNEYNVKLAEETNVSSEATYKRMKDIVFFLSVFILILGGILTFFITRNIVNSLTKCVNFLQVLANGDFTEEQDLEGTKRTDELGVLTTAVYSMQNSIKQLISNAKVEVSSIDQDVEMVQVQCGRLDDEVQAVSATTEQLAAAMQETAALGIEMLTMSGEITAVTGDMSEKSRAGAERVNEIKARAERASKMIYEGAEAADKILEESKKQLEQSIEESKVVEEINVLSEGIMQITQQTNMLALNASIEAARAGEAGRGFAVVANEISFLADESKKSVGSIQEVTGKVMGAVDQLVKSANTLLEYVSVDVKENNDKVLSVIDSYKNDAEFVNNLVAEVNEASEQMASTMGRMNCSIEAVSNAANESAEGTTVAANSLTEISMSAKEVLENVDRTKESKDKLDAEIQKFVV